MSAPMDEWVFDYVTGALGAVERAAFERAMERTPALRAEVEAAREVLAGLAAALPRADAPPDLRARVLISARTDLWTRVADRVAGVWDLARAQVLGEIHRAEDPSTWEAGPIPGLSLFHLTGGPATAGADVGIVRFAPGTRFPRHGHGGPERYVVLEGFVHDVSGQVERPGDVVEHGADEIHSFTTDPDGETAIALVLRGELQILGG